MPRYPLPSADIIRLRKVYARVPHVRCKGLCTQSCGVILMTPLEYKRICNVVGHDLNETKSLQCPLLVDGRCSQYQLRPLVCRLFGATDGLPCPHGCEADKPLTDDEAQDLIEAVREISGTGMAVASAHDLMTMARERGYLDRQEP
jgi:Fe-S-cluster containining protein